MPRWQKLPEEEGDDEEDVGGGGPGCSFSYSHRRHFSSALSNSHSHGLRAISVGCGGSRSRVSYSRLPEHELNLSIYKLDGSSFDIQVRRTATVAELELAVEEVFNQSPKEGEGSISWCHVWGHFCLQYDGKKLSNANTSLHTLGIKDGDQLYFVRHLSANQSLNRRRPKGEGCIVLRRNRTRR